MAKNLSFGCLRRLSLTAQVHGLPIACLRLDATGASRFHRSAARQLSGAAGSRIVAIGSSDQGISSAADEFAAEGCRYPAGAVENQRRQMPQLARMNCWYMRG
jgi:hypothetical protein